MDPSGEQFQIEGSGYRAVVTESGGALRLLEHRGRPLVDGFAQHEMSSGGRGQLLMPWPNRIRDGVHEFGGRRHQLALSDPGTRTASHGLARWAQWTAVDQQADSVTLTYRVMAQTGYPWTLDLRVTYSVSPAGLRVTQSATNRSSEPAPYASGAHPYLCVGTGIDHLELTLPATRRVLTDDRLLPTGEEEVAGTAHDFRTPRTIGSTSFNDAFGDLERDDTGTATVVLRDPASGDGVALWVDTAHGWIQLFSADEVPDKARRSLAVEPMTAPADAFNSGAGLVILAPAGQDGARVSATWGVKEMRNST
ncbi:aldose 1-epimerase family protein [Nocardioides houyundeii]|uniref:aldose 1-epimerase family protein n=1 Tax=Nocardioides houyundeii TaxID=2045452 RepID=UPI000C7579AA|nr:aldose 1-epimerase family protein [Nocardioides houyundeii]